MPMKLPNGYGSVTKLSGNRRNPYMARVTLGRDDYGQLVRKTLGYYHTRKEALAALADYNRDPYDLSAEKVTFGDMYNQWITRYAQTVTPAIVSKYQYLYKQCAPIADKPIADLKLIQLQTLIDNTNLTPATLAQLKSLLNLGRNVKVPHLRPSQPLLLPTRYKRAFQKPKENLPINTNKKFPYNR